jgi:DNA-binding beta-propeller fold protein YncE
MFDMYSYRTVIFMMIVASLLFMTMPLAAQDDDVIASGFSGPRNITYDAEGNLYVVEAGVGGPAEVEGTFGSPVNAGGTGQVSLVSANGDVSVWIAGLTSIDNGFRGAMDIAFVGDSVWLALGEGTQATPFSAAVVELDAETLRVRRYVDIWSVEAAENPDGDIVLSNPSDIAMSDDGTLYIVDASCNCVFDWSEDGGVSVFASWPITDSSAVPTAIALSPEGDIYVGMFSGWPHETGSAFIEKWSADGELLETIEGLTMITDLLVTDDGTLYAVELAREFGDVGYVADSGRIVAASMEGLTPVAEGLNLPYGIAITPDGDFAVAVNAIAFGPEGPVAGAGEVIRVGMGG